MVWHSDQRPRSSAEDSLAHLAPDFHHAPASLHGSARCVPTGRVLSLIGGLALLAAYFMPWFGLSSPQGSIVLSGEFLGRFLSGTTDLRRFMPGASGDPNEARLLQGLVYLFPSAGAVATVLDAPRDQVSGEVFNVGDTDENYRKVDIVELLKARFPEARVEFVHKDEDPRDYRVSFEKLNSKLGFEVERRVANGIDEVISLLGSGLLDDPYASVYRN